LRADDERTVWVNLLEDGTAVGVWMPREMAAKIERWGGYRQTGDTVRVTGVVNLACDRHGGDLDVHASRIEAIVPGALREESVRPFEAVVGALGFVVAAASALLARARERRTPKEG
ncbi:MAG: hypothetical protein N3B11_02690, partial [Coriobacteriia bacterium]|nr:hypothetical protein [Coriobacteriia bacterium]